MRVALALLLLSGCQWARVRYVDGAELSKDLACKVEANDFVCRDYFKALKADGVTLVPAPRGARPETVFIEL